jgi:RNA polymerase sigma-70 factor (ECF subfamily)
VYGELHQRARRFIGRERAAHSLQPTALIHEAYLRLVGARSVDWRDRSHFYALASRLMRQILVDYARSRRRQKRGGAAMPVVFDEARMAPMEQPDLVRLDEALQSLAETDERKSRVVELRFFGGLSAEETADVLKVSPQTVLRDLENRQGLAATGNGAGKPWPTLIAGRLSSESIRKPSIARSPNGLDSSIRPV